MKDKKGALTNPLHGLYGDKLSRFIVDHAPLYKVRLFVQKKVHHHRF